MMSRCSIVLCLSIFALVTLFGTFQTTSQVWARTRVPAHGHHSNIPVVLKRGSVFPPLEGRIVISNEPFEFSEYPKPLRAFLFEIHGCNIQREIEIDCGNHPDGVLYVPIFYFVTDERRPIPRQLRLKPPIGADLSQNKLELVQYVSAEVTYDNSAPQDFNPNGNRLVWVQVNFRNPGSKIPLGLQICDGPSKDCTDSTRLRSLADLFGASGIPAFQPEGVPPNKAVPPLRGTLPEPTLPGVGDATNPLPPIPENQIGQIPPKAGSKTPVDDSVSINLTINGAPPEYSEGVIARLIVSALSAVRSDDNTIAGIKDLRVNSGSTPSRSATLVVKRDLTGSLRIAGQPIDCNKAGCHAEISLRECTLILTALTAPEKADIHSIPVGQIGDAAALTRFYKRLHVDNIELPVLRRPDMSLPHLRIYLFDQSKFQLKFTTLSDATAPWVITPSDPGFATLWLASTPDFHWSLIPGQTLEMTKQSPQAAASKDHPAKPAAQVPQNRRVHLLLKARAQAPGWSVERANQRLLHLLQGNANNPVHVLLRAANGQVIVSERPKIETFHDGLVVWSGQIPQSGYKWEIEGVPVPISIPDEASNELAGDGNQRVHPNDLVFRAVATIPFFLLHDRWNLSILANNRVYGRETPIDANELCEFYLINQTTGSREGNFNLALQLADQKGTRILHTANPIEIAALPLGADQLQLDIRPRSGAARCVSSQTPLPPLSQWIVNEDSNVGILSVRTIVASKGRWLLGLYAPQDLGAVEGDSRSIADAQQEIFKRFSTWVEEWRTRYFASTEPARSALGYDLALLSGTNTAGQVNAAFTETSVITGRYRSVPTLTLQLDNEAGRRVNEFLSGPKSAGGAPPFVALTDSIRRYASLFGTVSGERAPMVIYLGANRPLQTSCREWTRTTQEISVLPGRPRVLGIIFTNSNTSDIGRDLGADTAVRPINFTTLSRGYSCEGANRSLLVFVPFSDLVAQRPGDVLDGVFRALDIWVADMERN